MPRSARQPDSGLGQVLLVSLPPCMRAGSAVGLLSRGLAGVGGQGHCSVRDNTRHSQPLIAPAAVGCVWFGVEGAGMVEQGLMRSMRRGVAVPRVL